MIVRRLLAPAVVWAAAVAVLAAAVAGNIQVRPVVAEGRVTASFVAPETFDTDAEAIVRSGLLPRLVSVAKRQIALRHGRFYVCSDMYFA